MAGRVRRDSVRLWIPRTPHLRDAAFEQLLLQHDVDIWRLRRRVAGAPPGESPSSPTVFPPGSSSSSSSSSSSECGLIASCTTSNQYTFTISGLSGGGSPDCANVNRTWTLSYVSSAFWKETLAGFPNWECRLDYFSPSHRLYFVDGSATRATYTSTCFDCEGSTVFNFVSSSRCSGWPSTITVAKV